MRRNRGFFWVNNWGFFREPDRYLSDLLESRAQDDKVVSDEVNYVLFAERWRVRLRYPLWAIRLSWACVLEVWYRWYPLESGPSFSEALGNKLATDPEAAGFTEAGKEALTKSKNNCSE
jgi:hypothetical protein